MKKLLAGAAVALALSAGAAHASTWLDLNVDTCTGTCGHFGQHYGWVKIDGLGTTTVTFDVTLIPDTYFNQAGHPDELFTLTGPTGIDVTSVTPAADFGNTGNQAAGAHSGGGSLGDFAYQILWIGNNGNSNLGDQELKFTVTGTSALSLGSGIIQHGHNPPTDSNIFFVADLIGPNGKTGNVGAVRSDGPVPEPATWALMLTGFGGLGAMLRRRRAGAMV